MTVHYSRFGLNTYCGVAYFGAHLPEDYPLHPVLQKSRAFRRLPPNLSQLAELAKHWSRHTVPPPQGSPDPFGIRNWYDDQGYELDFGTGRRLTDDEIDAQWDALGDIGLDDFVVHDIPVPSGGFADPDTWKAPTPSVDEDLVDRSGLTKAQILSDIQSRGRDATADEYGLPPQLAAKARTDTDFAHAILTMHGHPWSEYQES